MPSAAGHRFALQALILAGLALAACREARPVPAGTATGSLSPAVTPATAVPAPTLAPTALPSPTAMPALTPTPTLPPGATVTQPPPGQYLFLEWRSSITCSAQSPPVAVDFPTYRFFSGTLVMDFCPAVQGTPAPLGAGDWGFIGYTLTASGGQCSGEFSAPEPIKTLPYKAAGTDLRLAAIAQDGTVMLSAGREEMVLRPGQGREQTGVDALSTQPFSGTHYTTSVRLANYGWQDRSKIICSGR